MSGWRCGLALALLVSAAPLRALEVGSAAPAVVVAALSGDSEHRLEALRGKVVLVDFWASWCAPCLHALPAYAELETQLASRGFVVLAISVDEQRVDAERFLQRRPVAIRLAHDPTGTWAKAFDVKAMPSSYLIDREGVVREVHRGYRAAELSALRSSIEGLLGSAND